ncbi:MAG: Uma2 family endonuclease [Thermoplasmata archaeon]
MARRAEVQSLTAEEFYRLPDIGRPQELIEGFVVSEPVSSRSHGAVAASIVRILGNYVHTNGLGSLTTCDSGFILARDPDTVRGADVAFISWNRDRAAKSAGPYFPGAPDLAIEVLSPGNSPGDVRSKVADYLAAGTRLVWCVDPAKRRVRVYRALLAPKILTAEDELDGEDVVPGFRVKISGLFEL